MCDKGLPDTVSGFSGSCWGDARLISGKRLGTMWIMESQIQSVAVRAGGFLMSPLVWATMAASFLALMTGFVGRVVVLVEDVRTARIRSSRRAGKGGKLLPVSTPQLARRTRRERGIADVSQGINSSGPGSPPPSFHQEPMGLRQGSPGRRLCRASTEIRLSQVRISLLPNPDSDQPARRASSSRSGLTWRPYSGPHGVTDNSTANVTRSSKPQ